MVFSKITRFGNLRPETWQMQTAYVVNKCDHSRSRSFDDDLMLQDQASGERSQDQWSSGFTLMLSRNESTHNVLALLGSRVGTSKYLTILAATRNMMLMLY